VVDETVIPTGQAVFFDNWSHTTTLPSPAQVRQSEDAHSFKHAHVSPNRHLQLVVKFGHISTTPVSEGQALWLRATLVLAPYAGAEGVWLVRGWWGEVHLHGVYRRGDGEETLAVALRARETGRCGTVESDDLVNEMSEAGVWKYLHRCRLATCGTFIILTQSRRSASWSHPRTSVGFYPTRSLCEDVYRPIVLPRKESRWVPRPPMGYVSPSGLLRSGVDCLYACRFAPFEHYNV